MADREGEGRQEEGHGFINITFEWLNTLLGKLLVAELFLTLLCSACSSSVEWYPGSRCGGRIGFLDFVSWTAFINILIDVIIRILGLWNRLLWIFHHPVLHLVLCGLAVGGFLIGSACIASCAKAHLVYNSGAAAAAAIFGFICLGLFAFESFLHYRRLRAMQAEGRQQTTSDEFKADVI